MTSVTSGLTGLDGKALDAWLVYGVSGLLRVHAWNMCCRFALLCGDAAGAAEAAFEAIMAAGDDDGRVGEDGDAAPFLCIIVSC